MEELAFGDPRRDPVFQRKPHGRTDGIQAECTGSFERTGRVSHLLLHNLRQHADAEQEMRNLQEYFPFRLLVQVV